MATRPRLILVSPDECGGPEVARLVASLPAMADAVDAVILRWKREPAAKQVMAARELVAIEARPRLLISDRIDVAMASGTDGVQLPESGASASDVRAVWPTAMIGVSRHDADGACERSAGADLVIAAPVFETTSKPGGRPLGIDGLRAIVRATKLGVIALGGVDPENVAALLAAGARGIAVRGAVFAHADPVARVRLLREALDSAAATLPDDEFVTGPDGGVRPE